MKYTTHNFVLLEPHNATRPHKWLIVFVFFSFNFINPTYSQSVDLSDLTIPLSQSLQLPSLHLLETEATKFNNAVSDTKPTKFPKSLNNVNASVTTILLPNGDRYFGRTKSRIPNGDGLYIFSQGNIYLGNFSMGRFSGFGTYVFSSGTRYVGHFSDNQRHGDGKTIFQNGSQHEGQYEFDLPHGDGYFVTVAKNRFVGKFIDGNLANEGILMGRDGRKYEVKKISTTWIEVTRSKGKHTTSNSKFKSDFIYSEISISVAEECSKQLGISFPSDSFSDITWNRFKTCVTENKF
jgi:hypothetical protein